MVCRLCGGTGRVPLPRGMSVGFYEFMRGVERCDDGSLWMICPGCETDIAAIDPVVEPKVGKE